MPDAVVIGVIDVVGLHGGVAYGAEAIAALTRADVVVGSARHLDASRSGPAAERIDLASGLDAVLDLLADRLHENKQICFLASGDPGFFGIVRLLADRFGPAVLSVFPAPSSVSLAFARVGLSWDDAVIASAHGRDLHAAVDAIRFSTKAAVLTSPENPPEAVGKALVAGGFDDRSVVVVSCIGEPDEAVHRTDIDGLASGAYEPMSVVILTSKEQVADRASVAWGRSSVAWGQPTVAFEHRDGMITKPEVRAVVLSKLCLPSSGVVWDIGAGSGSVGIEVALIAPWLRVVALERSADDVDRIRRNAEVHRVQIDVVLGEAPAALVDLPDPERVFVGGGGLDVIDAAFQRLRPGGLLVATHVLLDRAAASWARLGNIIELTVNRGAPIGSGVRLQAENPIFVTWGWRS